MEVDQERDSLALHIAGCALGAMPDDQLFCSVNRAGDTHRVLCCLRALLGERETFGWWWLHGSRGRCGRRFAGLDGRGRCVDFSLALKGLPVGGKGGVDEPGGRGLVAFERCERGDGQGLIAALRRIPVLAEVAFFEGEGV